MRRSEVCPGSSHAPRHGHCPMCGGPAEILLRSGDGTRPILGWHAPWRGYDTAAAAQREEMQQVARDGLRRGAALLQVVETAIAEATRLVALAEPLLGGGRAPHQDATRALRAFSELELAGRSAARAATHVSQARHAIGGDDAEAAGSVPAGGRAAPARERGFVDSHQVLRATARTAVIAEMSSDSIREAVHRCETAVVDRGMMSSRQHRQVSSALRSTLTAARLSDEVRARTGNAGRQLARAVGWEGELPVLLSEARAAAARDPDAASLLSA